MQTDVESLLSRLLVCRDAGLVLKKYLDVCPVSLTSSSLITTLLTHITLTTLPYSLTPLPSLVKLHLTPYPHSNLPLSFAVAKNLTQPSIPPPPHKYTPLTHPPACLPQSFRLNQHVTSTALSMTASSCRQWAIAPRGRTDLLANGTCPVSPTWPGFSRMRVRSTRTCQNGLSLAS